MMLGGIMGDGGAAVEGHESGGGSSEVGGGASSSMMLPAAEEISELRSGGGGGNRWPRQETLALLKIRSDMDVTFRDSSLKGPLWEEVSRKLAELGFHRSAKKCKEKFENVYKYHKRTKDGRTSKPDGKTYRFFDQLEALENTTPAPPPIPFTPPPPRPQTSTTTAPPMNAMPSSSQHHGVTVSSTSPSPSPTPLSVAPPNAATAVPRTVSFPMSTLPFQPPLQPQPINISIPPQNHGFQQQPSSNAHHISPSMLSNSTSSSTSSDEDIQRRRGKKRKWKDYFERLVRDVVHKQEELQKKFLDALEKRERDRIAREEAWKVQEMARMNREHDLLVQERSVAAAKDAAVIAFLQKVTDQHNLQLPVSINNVAPTQQVHENHNQPQKPPPPPAPTATATETPTPTPQPQPQQPHQSSTPAPQTATPTPTVQQSMPPPPQAMAITPTNASKTDNGGDNFLPASSSRWPKAEVQALINLRTSLDIKYQENGPKSPLWEEISAAMRKLGYNRSAKRCKEKWENINKYYKKVKESSKKRPEDSKTCPYFHQLEAIYKDKAKINDLPSSFNPVGSGGYAMMKPGNNSPMVPIMARPEQQWPQQQQHHEAMHDNESDINNEHDDDDEDDDAYDEEEEGGGGFEIMANNNNNSSSNKKQPPNTAE